MSAARFFGAGPSPHRYWSGQLEDVGLRQDVDNVAALVTTAKLKVPLLSSVTAMPDHTVILLLGPILVFIFWGGGSIRPMADDSRMDGRGGWP